MPLGDSITRGITGSTTGGYRGTLFNSLITAGYNIDFVGGEEDGTLTDDDHEGHSGFEAQQIRDNVTTYLNNNPADIVLLHIGTNDLEAEQAVSGISSEVNELLDNIDTYETTNSKTVYVFLAKIILDDNDDEGENGTKATLTKAFNDELATLSADKINNGDKLILVNMQDALDYPASGAAAQTMPPANLEDLFWGPASGATLLHPNQSGYDKIANQWFNALQNYFAPSLLLPMADAKDVSINPNLTWTASTISNSNTKYRLQISTDPLFASTEIDVQNITSAFYNVTQNLDFGTKYYWRVNAQNFGGTSNWSSIRSFTTEPMQVYVKVFLQGPYISSTSPNMNTNLSGLTDFPKTQPYTGSPWNYGGNEIVTTVPSGVVDWVLVQLRTGTAASTAVKARAAFLMSDGSIHDIDGSAYINFTGISSGNYYIVVKHRNHLAVMSSIAVALGDSSTLYDFTIAQTQAYGTNPMASLSGGKFGMYAGDTNGDGNITGTDFNLFNPDFIDGVSGYNAIDWNLDGNTTGSDFNIFNPNFINGKSSYVQ